MENQHKYRLSGANLVHISCCSQSVLQTDIPPGTSMEIQASFFRTLDILDILIDWSKLTSVFFNLFNAYLQTKCASTYTQEQICFVPSLTLRSSITSAICTTPPASQSVTVQNKTLFFHRMSPTLGKKTQFLAALLKWWEKHAGKRKKQFKMNIAKKNCHTQATFHFDWKLAETLKNHLGAGKGTPPFLF